jgi:hypothetical protein
MLCLNKIKTMDNVEMFCEKHVFHSEITMLYELARRSVLCRKYFDSYKQNAECEEVKNGVSN